MGRKKILVLSTKDVGRLIAIASELSKRIPNDKDVNPEMLGLVRDCQGVCEGTYNGWRIDA